MSDYERLTFHCGLRSRILDIRALPGRGGPRELSRVRPARAGLNAVVRLEGIVCTVRATVRTQRLARLPMS